MVVTCSAYKCRARYDKNSPVTFHSIPKDPDRRDKWVAALKIDGFIPKPHTKICSNHFTHDSFDCEKFGGKWLKSNAVPSIFTHLPESSERIPTSVATQSILVHDLIDSGESNMVDDPMTSSDSGSNFQYLKENTPLPERLAHSENVEEDIVSSYKIQKRRSIANNIIHTQKKTIQRLQLQNRHLQKKIELLTEMIVTLKKEKYESSEERDTLEESNEGPSSETVYSPTIIKISLP